MGAAVNQPRAPARLLVADDHTMLRSALCDILRLEPALEIVAEAGNGEETVALAVAHHPDLVLLDVEMPGQTVAVTVQQLHDQVPAAKVLILSMYDDKSLVHDLMALGVCAYLHKSASREALVSALCLVAASDEQVVISVPRQSLAEGTGPSPRPTSPVVSSLPPVGPPLLSARELEVLELVATARSNRQIAVRLGITESTVKRHLRNIFAKLGAVSRIDAVNKAKQAGLGDPFSQEFPGEDVRPVTG